MVARPRFVVANLADGPQRVLQLASLDNGRLQPSPFLCRLRDVQRAFAHVVSGFVSLVLFSAWWWPRTPKADGCRQHDESGDDDDETFAFHDEVPPMR